MSALTLADVTYADDAIFHASAATWKSLATAIDQAADVLVKANQKLPDAWPTGEASQAAQTRGAELYTEAAAAYRPAMNIGNALENQAYAMADLRELALDIINEAQRAGYHVDLTTGMVTAPPVHDTTDAAISDQYVQGCNAYAEQLTSVLARARSLDDATAAIIGANLPDPVTGFGNTTLSSTVLRETIVGMQGREPKDVNTWWGGLTPQQREQALRDHPDLLGNLDGIPAVDRDIANLTMLDRDLADLSERRGVLARQRDECLKHVTKLTASQIETIETELADVDAKIRGLHQIAGRIKDPTKPQAFLLGFSVGGDGRAIVAIGNPDKANNVLTYVPGTGSDITHTSGDIDRADRMATDVARKDPNASSSTIMWLGYDAPDNIPFDATRDLFADLAADDLDRFQTGLRVTHDSSNESHNVVLGHSYGSTVVDHAATGGHTLDANDVVLVASPGGHAEQATDLHLHANDTSGTHVWATTAANDCIGYSPAHGTAPDDPDFGAKTFSSAPGRAPIISGDFMPAHSEYWDKDNVARDNIALILSGRDDEVK